ncbi:UDP-4-amino-4,6-dideoxy-N-acetyl-beta-L-altrosamine transaminase [Pseudodesulfovibrio sp. zrk46]|uniref:UDP-4-amino-4, 6-dideoxy-N-acetyl-beta-L-altrosamine transaminase n=1 Tax=Pseudodesulfovibrio sp. zrk46 TaxID=2725288 RepID=UPI0014499010|nr:UDP-4-amino-4,6-dideoxy-N-acetyl-beta-L-altrosamine transaminase [Pseudodesulfovibrio sp. zrk46]QJB58051.1 UDP-4-amino-4,6-dideoxy-N-acetyl-beta-L-altrosamine transaminase [Pseudodesulfovibrio sp. zrk46]
MPKIPYGRQHIDEDDIRAVAETLRSDFLTTGPKVGEFEQAVANFCNVQHGVAVCNGTAALHAAMFALGIGSGDEVIVPPMTFAASANCVLYMGGTPVFADVQEGSLLIDPAKVKEKITSNTKAIIAVDYTGQPCNWEALRSLADKHNLALVADGCHALGASYKDRKVGSIADMTVFSFHPVKHVATGEGGMILTDDAELDAKLRTFRNHGITTDARTREESGAWFYEMVELGYNYRITDIQAALGVSQMAKLPAFLERRREIAKRYDKSFAGTNVIPLAVSEEVEHAYHLYVVRLANRDEVYTMLRDAGIFAQVHYIPVHLHPYYQEKLGTGEGLCPIAEAAYKEILSLPMYPGLTDQEQDYVIKTVLELA